MTATLLKNAVVAASEGLLERGAVLMENGVIASVGEERPADRVIDLDGRTLLPGFIDIHNHGAMGIDVNEADADGLRAVGAYLVTQGVTGWMPTFVPDSVDTYRRVVSAMREVVGTQDAGGAARILGVHYEGIFANVMMCGALRPEYFREFSGTELDDIPELEGCAHMTTFAPEVAGGIELVRRLTERGWIPSVGHTQADLATLERAREAGARHVTHLFNAMSGLHHRDVGVVGWALSSKDVTCDIIADGIHVAPRVLGTALEVKTPDGLMLISDSVAPTGKGDGRFELWGETVTVTDGRTRNEKGSIAGSVISMADAVRTYMGLGVSPSDIAKMAAGNPARLLGAEGSVGRIAPGLRADLAVLDPEGRVSMTLVGGEVVFGG